MGPDKVAYARYGSAASADILCRALSSNSYEGWPRARRMINLLACHTTRPGRAIRAKRTAPVSEYGAGFEALAGPLSAQHQPLHRRVQSLPRSPIRG